VANAAIQKAVLCKYADPDWMVGKPEVTRFHPSRGLLATNLPLFPRRLQLPIRSA